VRWDACSAKPGIKGGRGTVSEGIAADAGRSSLPAGRMELRSNGL